MRCINDVAQHRLAITSRFELAVIAVIVAIAGIVFVAVEAQAERLEVTLAIRNMRSGLQLAMAQRLMRGEEDRMSELEGANPLDFLGLPGAKYDAPGGRWQFDAKRHELIYRPGISVAFGGRAELRWSIEARRGPNGRVSDLRLREAPPDARAR